MFYQIRFIIQAAFDETLKIPSQNGEKLLIFEGQDDLIPDEDWVAAPVKKGQKFFLYLIVYLNHKVWWYFRFFGDNPRSGCPQK